LIVFARAYPVSAKWQIASPDRPMKRLSCRNQRHFLKTEQPNHREASKLPVAAGTGWKPA
jgi:hypothetical protein